MVAPLHRTRIVGRQNATPLAATHRHAQTHLARDVLPRKNVRLREDREVDFPCADAVTVVDDTLFPSAKQGDVNIVVAPLQKAVIKFKSNEITGQFLDTSDIWYKALGIYLREDVVQANKDVINWVSSTTPGK